MAVEQGYSVLVEISKVLESIDRIFGKGFIISIVLTLGAIVVGLIAHFRAKSTVPIAPLAMAPATSGVWFVRFFSGPAQGMSGKFHVTGGQLVFWGEHAVQPSWAIAATAVGVHPAHPVGPMSGNVVLNWQGTDVECLVSRGHSAAPHAGLMPGGPGFAQALSYEADSFIRAMIAHGATLVGPR